MIHSQDVKSLPRANALELLHLCSLSFASQNFKELEGP